MKDNSERGTRTLPSRGTRKESFDHQWPAAARTLQPIHPRRKMMAELLWGPWRSTRDLVPRSVTFSTFSQGEVKISEIIEDIWNKWIGEAAANPDPCRMSAWQSPVNGHVGHVTHADTAADMGVLKQECIDGSWVSRTVTLSFSISSGVSSILLLDWIAWVFFWRFRVSIKRSSAGRAKL